MSWIKVAIIRSSACLETLVIEARTFELADAIASEMPAGGSDRAIRVEP
jgi:hypothetical protein